jgi:CRISPR/Cas system-associated exonuclease Cas4 (RecB family)
LAGIPDYIFKRRDNTKFVIEEKHTWTKETISAPHDNHVIQILGYIYGFKKLELSSGYIIYFYWNHSEDGGGQPYDRVDIFPVIKSDAAKNQVIQAFQNVRAMKDGKVFDFDPAQSFFEKCYRCSFKALCNHKSGLHTSVNIPYPIKLCN